MSVKCSTLQQHDFFLFFKQISYFSLTSDPGLVLWSCFSLLQNKLASHQPWGTKLRDCSFSCFYCCFLFNQIRNAGYLHIPQTVHEHVVAWLEVPIPMPSTYPPKHVPAKHAYRVRACLANSVYLVNKITGKQYHHLTRQKKTQQWNQSDFNVSQQMKI